MRLWDVSFCDDETGENFNYSTEVEDPTIAGDLNVMITLLRAAGYGDNLIEKMIGCTYFDEGMFPDLDSAMDEAINEYIASRDVSDKRLDDVNEFPEN